MSTAKRIFLVLILVTGLAPFASGQEYRGSIGGQITDQSGEAIAGARVALVNIGTNTRLESTSDADGNYRFRLLPPADYRLEVEAQGFRRVRQDTITVNIGDVLKLDFK